MFVERNMTAFLSQNHPPVFLQGLDDFSESHQPGVQQFLLQ